jgi:integrase
VKWRDHLRNEIRANEFRDPDEPLTAPLVSAAFTLGDICDSYEKVHVKTPTRRERARQLMIGALNLIRRTEIPAGEGTMVRMEQKPIDAFKPADIEAFRVVRRELHQQALLTLKRVAELETKAGEATDRKERRQLRDQAMALRRVTTSRPGPKGGEVGTDRLLARLRQVFAWAIKHGHIEQTPFKRAGQVVVELARRAETPRERRLDVGEEERLLAHAGSHLRALIVAALSTGCRKGELLSLQWSQIRRDDKGQPRWIVLSAARTKTNEARTIPIATRLRAELEMRRTGADGKDHTSDKFVFGNEVGEQVGSIKTA